MIHPNTELRFINPQMGAGVFATQAIPKGTIVYVQDALDIVVTRRNLKKLAHPLREMVEKYAFIDPQGNYVVCWDHAKYVNHKCECNVISSGYGFEIALRDIQVDEEITGEYALYNYPFPDEIDCGCVNCRKAVRATDIDTYHPLWDSWVQAVLPDVLHVEQPLWSLLDTGTVAHLTAYLAGNAVYRSLKELKWEGLTKPTKIRQPKPHTRKQAA